MKKFFSRIALELAELDDSPKKLRQFGYLFAAIGFAFAVLLYMKNTPGGALVSLLSSVIFFTVAVYAPQALKDAHRIWMAFAFTLGLIVGTLVLSILFYLLITPVGLLRRVLSGDPLDRRFGIKEKSYWKKHAEPKEGEMKRPF